MNRIEEIKERLREAQYAIRCAKGAGPYGITESRMMTTFVDHAPDDIEYLLGLLEEKST